MTKTERLEALEALALWANLVRTRTPIPANRPRYAGIRLQEAAVAVEHGANAVRAIRDSIAREYHAEVAQYHAINGVKHPLEVYAVTEARRAFSCALAAVGLGREL